MVKYHLGLDLGKERDYSALAITETHGAGLLVLRHLERYALGTDYRDVVARVALMMHSPKLGSSELIVDATGVGVAVVERIREEGLPFKAITITAGQSVTQSGPDSYHVPKKTLIAALEVPFRGGKLQVASGLELWPALKGEMLNFRRKINSKTAHTSYEHRRPTDHDDLVLATALACWGATSEP